MLGKLIFLFTVVPIVELLILIEIGGAIGVLNTVLLVLITGIVGAVLAKSEGRQIIANIQRETSMGRMPGDELINGLSVLLGGAMLVTPGIFTDVVGFTLVIPFTRGLLIGFIKKQVKGMIKEGNVKVYYNSPLQGQRPDVHRGEKEDFQKNFQNAEDVDYEEVDKE